MNLTDTDLDLMLDALLIMEERLRLDYAEEVADDDDPETLERISARQDSVEALTERVGRALDHVRNHR